MRLAYTADAAADLDQIWDFLAPRSPIGAQHVIEAIHAAAQRLTRFPELGRTGQDVRTRELDLAEYPYLLVYRVEDITLIVLRVYHTSRDRPRTTL
jgi:toxin ParE1/3/4